MPRPCKRRRICGKPACASFGPRGERQGEDVSAPQTVIMTLDEFETIRLIDLVGLTQEQCAEQMDVARTTAQAIYCSARGKLAECLVLGKELVIEGGNYVVCDRAAGGCGRGCHGGGNAGADASDAPGHVCHRHCRGKQEIGESTQEIKFRRKKT